MCKPFPPPLVRGGVFLVGSDTKYRVIADGNLGQGVFCTTLCGLSDTKYRVIADGNGRGPRVFKQLMQRQIPSTAL